MKRSLGELHTEQLVRAMWDNSWILHFTNWKCVLAFAKEVRKVGGSQNAEAPADGHEG